MRWPRILQSMQVKGENVIAKLLPSINFCFMQTEFLWYAEKKVWSILSWYVVGNWISQWGNDVFIWENKTFMRRPFLVKVCDFDTTTMMVYLKLIF